MSQTIFQANLTADEMYIDLANMPPTTFIQQFVLQIQNQSLQTLYFLLDVSNLPNWSISNPATGQLGGVAAGSTVYLYPMLSRSTPVGDTTDTGYLTIMVYSDAGYTTQLDTSDLNCTVYLENTEIWSDVTIEPFAVGNSYGWSGGTLNNDISVEVAGYNYTTLVFSTNNADQSQTLTRNNTVLPATSKVRMTFYGVIKGARSGLTSASAFLKRVQVQVNGVSVYDTDPSSNSAKPTKTAPTVPWIQMGTSATYSQPWIKFTCDLSAYSGQTVNITIIITLYNSAEAGSGTMADYFIMDRVVRAGEN